jgi:hypothetical protein
MRIFLLDTSAMKGLKISAVPGPRLEGIAT